MHDGNCKYNNQLICKKLCHICCLTCEKDCNQRCDSSLQFNNGQNLELLLKCDGVFLALKLAYKNKDGFYENPSKEWEQLIDVFYFAKKLRETHNKKKKGTIIKSFLNSNDSD